MTDDREILLICTGNICRSPFMEYTLRQALDRAGTGGLTISSAGTRAVVGAAPHRRVLAEFRKRGVDASGFAARQLTAELADRATLIVTATREQRAAVGGLAPRRRNNLFTLRQLQRLLTVASNLPPAVAGPVDTGTAGDPIAALLDLLTRARGLSGGADAADDIADPLAGGPFAFRKAFKEIDGGVVLLAEQLTALARSTPRGGEHT